MKWFGKRKKPELPQQQPEAPKLKDKTVKIGRDDFMAAETGDGHVKINGFTANEKGLKPILDLLAGKLDVEFTITRDPSRLNLGGDASSGAVFQTIAKSDAPISLDQVVEALQSIAPQDITAESHKVERGVQTIKRNHQEALAHEKMQPYLQATLEVLTRNGIPTSPELENALQDALAKAHMHPERYRQQGPSPS